MRLAARNRYRRGVTLVELMIAMALISIGILALVQSFGFIQKAVQAAKNRTLASNLAQEKMQILKQKTYYQVLVTSDPAHNTTDFAPDSIDYDTGYFPPENVTEAGVTYARYTYVQVAAEDSGDLKTLSPTTPDTGMKLITVTVVWSQGGVKKKLSVRSILSNPDTVMSNSIFKGKVRDAATSLPIQGAVVNVAENMGWRDTTNSYGDYSINVLLGNYNMLVTAEGYYPALKSVSVSANAAQTQDFSLVKIATGSVSGSVWLRDHLLISQVVASTTMVNGTNVEYIELFNPTTAAINIGSSSGNSVKVAYLGESGAGQDVAEFALNYVSTYVPAGRFFLIANTSTMTVGGYSPMVDAVYAASNQPPCSLDGSVLSCIHAGKAGAIVLTNSSGKVLDKLGWSNTSGGKAAPDYEGTAYAMTSGLPAGKQLVRMSQPCSLSSNYGRAYDSGVNSADFYYMDVTYQPYCVASGAKTSYSGTPAVGAVVTATDGLSSSTAAWLTGGTCAYSTFTLVDVATGTWTVLISSGSAGLQNDAVVVPSAGAVYPFASTATVLTQDMTTGLISGRVLNVYGSPLGVTVSPGGAGSNTTSNSSTGRYTLRVSTGLVDVTANPTSAGNSSYVTLSSNSIQVELGQVCSDVDFVLYQGGKITGFVTRDGVNALPGVSVAILDANGLARDQRVTGIDGRFTTATLSTGTYTVQPAIGAKEMATPDSSTVSLVTAGLTKFSSTFTVSGAMGYITGSVSKSGSPIKTGVLIVVTTTTLPGTPPAPPALSTATMGGVPYYIVSSMEDGTYRAEVTQSTSTKYSVYAYYPTPSGSSAVIVSSKTTNISVTAGQTTSGVNFSW